jgi:hypothetical protein
VGMLRGTVLSFCFLCPVWFGFQNIALGGL